MAHNYFRVTVYHPAEDISAIMDSYGMFEKLWQFSSLMIQKGFKVLEVSASDKFLEGNIVKVEPDTDKFFLRAWAKGAPKHITHKAVNDNYSAVEVMGKIYIPDKSAII